MAVLREMVQCRRRSVRAQSRLPRIPGISGIGAAHLHWSSPLEMPFYRDVVSHTILSYVHGHMSNVDSDEDDDDSHDIFSKASHPNSPPAGLGLSLGHLAATPVRKPGEGI